MRSFTDVFRDLSVLFVLLVPLLFLMKSPHTGKGRSRCTERPRGGRRNRPAVARVRGKPASFAS